MDTNVSCGGYRIHHVAMRKMWAPSRCSAAAWSCRTVPPPPIFHWYPHHLPGPVKYNLYMVFCLNFLVLCRAYVKSFRVRSKVQLSSACPLTLSLSDVSRSSHLVILVRGICVDVACFQSSVLPVDLQSLNMANHEHNRIAGRGGP
jgi:hypothetical protein